MTTLNVKGKSIELLDDGFMTHREDWTDEVAEALAEKEGIKLSDDHWEVIFYLRKHYKDFLISPNVKILVKHLQEEHGEEKMNTKHLYNIFPKGPSFQGCKIAGLPKPTNCIDG